MVSIEPQPLSVGPAAALNPPVAEAAPAVQSEAPPAVPAPAEDQVTPEPPRQAARTPVDPTPRPPPVVKPPPPPSEAPPPPLPRDAGPAPTPAPPGEPVAAPTPTPDPVNASRETVTEAEVEAAWQTDASSWKPQVTLERSPAPPPPPPVRPAPRPPTAPRTAQAPGARLQDYPPRTSSLGGPSSSSFDQAPGDGGARNDYLSRVYRHIDPHRAYPAGARAARQHGRVVTRVTINRAGELLDIRLDRSSGWPLIDAAEMAAIRRAMPLPPVPDGMRGDPVVLVLPMNY